MICDRIENLSEYVSLGPAYAEVMDFVEGYVPSEFPPGSYKLSDRVTANVQEYAPGENPPL